MLSHAAQLRRVVVSRGSHGWPLPGFHASLTGDGMAERSSSLTMTLPSDMLSRNLADPGIPDGRRSGKRGVGSAQRGAPAGLSAKARPVATELGQLIEAGCTGMRRAASRQSHVIFGEGTRTRLEGAAQGGAYEPFRGIYTGQASLGE